MGKPIVALNLFPQFSVNWGENYDSGTNLCRSVFVLDSLLHVMNFHLPIKDLASTTVLFDLQRGNPNCLKESRIIFLSCSPSHWTQTTYQLAHEMCHLVISAEVIPELQWLEESICELSSLYFLPKISKLWKDLDVRLPASNNTLYSSLFEKYALDSRSDITPFNLSLLATNPVESELSSLIADCYQRSKNRYVSLQLLPIFEHFPKTWHAIPYLSKVPDQLSFPDSLAKWIELSPTESRIGLQEMAAVFGASIPLA